VKKRWGVKTSITSITSRVQERKERKKVEEMRKRREAKTYAKVTGHQKGEYYYGITSKEGRREVLLLPLNFSMTGDRMENGRERENCRGPKKEEEGTKS